MVQEQGADIDAHKQTSHSFIILDCANNGIKIPGSCLSNVALLVKGHAGKPKPDSRSLS